MASKEMMSSIDMLAEEELKRIEREKKAAAAIALQDANIQEARNRQAPERTEAQQAVLSSADRTTADLYGAKRERDSRWKGQGGLGFAIAPILNMFGKDKTQEYSDEKFKSLSQARKVAQQGKSRERLVNSLKSIYQNQDVKGRERDSREHEKSKRNLEFFEDPNDPSKRIGYYNTGFGYRDTDNNPVDPRIVERLIPKDNGATDSIDLKNFKGFTNETEGTLKFKEGFRNYLLAKGSSGSLGKPSATLVKSYQQGRGLLASFDRAQETLNSLDAKQSEQLDSPLSEIGVSFAERWLPEGVGRYMNENTVYTDESVRDYRTQIAKIESDFSKMMSGMAVTIYEMSDRKKWSPYAEGISQQERESRMANLKDILEEEQDFFEGYYPAFAGQENSTPKGAPSQDNSMDFNNPETSDEKFEKWQQDRQSQPPQGVSAELWSQYTPEEQEILRDKI
jgi:hypothetical protein